MLAGGLALLTVGAEMLVRGAVSLARRLGIPPLVIGLTVVGFGTSTPELATSVGAALKGYDGIAVGNCIGSNIFNVAVILGLTALVAPIAVHRRVIWREVPVVGAVALLPLLGQLTGGGVPRWAGAVMLAGLGLYLFDQFRAARRPDPQAADPQSGDAAIEASMPRDAVWNSAVFIAIGLVGLVLGARGLVLGAVDIARAFGLSELVIGLTIVAAGTSMPELVTSLVAARRGQSDVAVGNVLGSNVFNICGILGLTALIRPQAIQPQTLWLDIPVMLAVSLALLPIMRSGHRVSRAEGAGLVLSFVAYTVVLLAFAPRWFGGA